MKKKNVYLYYIYGVILIIVIIYIVPPIIHAFKSSNCTYMPTLKNQGRFYYLFKDKTAKNYKTVFSAGKSQKGWIYSYVYKKEIRITIWELLNEENLRLNDFVFRNSNSSFKIKNNSYSLSDIGPYPVIRIENEDCLNLTNKVNIYFRGKKNYIDTLKNQKVLDFQGKVQEINFVNENNECQIRMYSLSHAIVTNLLIFKTKKSIMIIFINPIGESSFSSNPIALFDFD